jgi:hypothetical protein
MHRTHMGVDQHYENITKQCSRTALADGWGGSMVATEISDILFGTPSPVAVDVNMGVLKEDQVNVIVHGHEPNLFESMLVSVNGSHARAESQGCRRQRHQPGGHVLLRCRNDVATRHSPCRQLHVHRSGSGDRGRGCHVRRRAVHQAGTGQPWPTVTRRRFSPPTRAATSKGPPISSSTSTPRRPAPTPWSSRPSAGSKTARPVEIPKNQPIGRARVFPRVHQLYAGRHPSGLLYPAQRQHHQRPHPRRGRGRGLHQPPGQTGLGACGTGQRAHQERRSGASDRLFPDCPGQGRPLHARSGAPGRGADCGKCAKPWACRRYWGWGPAWTTAAF